MATRGTETFPNLTADLIEAVERWSAETDDALLDAMTVEPPVLFNDKNFRQDGRPIRPTLQSIQAQFDRLSNAGDAALKSVCAAYCARRPQFSGDSVAMACALLQQFIESQLHVSGGFPYAVLAVFVVRNGIMDRVCNCPGDPI